MCKVKPPIAERHDVVVWEEMEIINKFNYFLSYPIDGHVIYLKGESPE